MNSPLYAIPGSTPAPSAAPAAAAAPVAASDPTAGARSVAEVLAKTTLARQWLDSPAIDAGQSAHTLRVSAHIPEASPAVQDVFVPSFRRWSQQVPAKFMLQREMSTA